MATTDPGVDDIEQAIAELLREEEIGSLAVVGPGGAPAVSMMHFASDGLVVYVHTFTYSRKHVAIQRDPRVSYTIAAIPARRLLWPWQATRHSGRWPRDAGDRAS